MASLNGKRMFPCPVCADPREVRESKKGKPYIVCDSCGVQLFVRNENGIRGFEELVAAADEQNIWDRIVELKGRYQKKCPECGKKFWITEDSIATSWLDGSFSGFRCPEEGCSGVVKPEGK
jgi:hypothetical protein